MLMLIFLILFFNLKYQLVLWQQFGNSSLSVMIASSMEILASSSMKLQMCSVVESHKITITISSTDMRELWILGYRLCGVHSVKLFQQLYLVIQIVFFLRLVLWIKLNFKSFTMVLIMCSNHLQARKVLGFNQAD